MPAWIHWNLRFYHRAIHRIIHTTFYRYDIQSYRRLCCAWGYITVDNVITWFSTESYGRKSATASQRRAFGDLYRLGFIIASVCGGLLCILTIYCLITQKVWLLLFCFFLKHVCPNNFKHFGPAFQSYCNKVGLGSLTLLSGALPLAEVPALPRW